MDGQYQLPKDIEIDILIRLPVKSIMRFKSVCRSWYNLVKSSLFINIHRNHTVTSPRQCLVTWFNYSYRASLLCRDTYNITSDIDLSANRLQHLNIAGSCNGLVCVWDKYTDNWFVLNPATRELKCHPPPPPLSSHRRNFTASIVFGFDNKNDDYKVVRIIDMVNEYDSPLIPQPVQIYSSRRNEWRNTDLVAPAMVRSSLHNPCIDGVYYNWLGYTHEISRLILSFDVVKEEFTTTMLPNYITRDRHNLVIWKGTLAIITYPFITDQPLSFCFEIWVMTKPCQEWTKQVATGPITGIGRPLAVCGDEETIFFERSIGASLRGEVVSYDIKTQNIKHLRIYGRPLRFQVAFYDESLVSVD